MKEATEINSKDLSLRFRDEEIDYSDAPPIQDWSRAVKGTFLESLRILRDRRKADSKKVS